MADQHFSVPPSGDGTRSQTILRLAVLAALLTIGLTAVTFWLSYEALHTLASANGLRGERAWAWPATIDAFIVIGEVLILRASLLRRVDWLAVFLTASGSVGSIVLNVASAGEVAPMAKVVHAVPPCAALLIFTALMRQIYRALSAPVVAPSTSVDKVDDTPVVARVAPVEPTPVVPPKPEQAPQPPPAEEEQRPAPIVYRDPRCLVVRPLYDTGTRPGTGAMRAALAAAGHGRVVDSTIRGTIRAEVEEHEPHLGQLPPAIATARTA
ncbi:DUF2637 domain-containing protein [Streptomyces sp. NPDC048332]|uniref:DUF2637 domain-containing protein n=1 Tax=Streptomyces sp. NPDC048332 TaxID=3154619 RepID=UPI00343594D4